MTESGMYNLQTMILIKLASIFIYPTNHRKLKKPSQVLRTDHHVAPERSHPKHLVNHGWLVVDRNSCIKLQR